MKYNTIGGKENVKYNLYILLLSEQLSSRKLKKVNSNSKCGIKFRGYSNVILILFIFNLG